MVICSILNHTIFIQHDRYISSLLNFYQVLPKCGQVTLSPRLSAPIIISIDSIIMSEAREPLRIQLGHISAQYRSISAA